MQVRNTGNRGRRQLLVLMVVASLVASAQPASAGPLDELLGWGDDGSEPSGDGGGSSTATAPPPDGVTIEAESLDGGTVVVSDGAHGGAFLRTLHATAVPGVDSGFHEVTVRAKGIGGRLRITVNGAVVAEYTLRKAWSTVSAVIRTPSSRPEVGLVAEQLPWRDSAASIDVDWLHLGDHERRFTTSGGRILGPDGTAVVPRGITFPGYQAAGSLAGLLQLPASMADEQYAWGITLVRLPLNQEHWLSNCPSLKDGVQMGYRAAVADEVDRLTSRGIMAMLTLTRTERGKATGCAPAANPPLKEMADERSLPFWRSVASRFADNTLAVFDLFNEPHSISDAIWHRGGTVTYKDNSGLLTRQSSYQAVGMQTLYNAVRGTGADNLVFVSGTGWAADTGVALRKPLSGYGIVLAPHTYCHDCSSPSLHPSLDWIVDDAVRSWYPVVMTETGWIHPWTSVYNRKFVDWASERDMGWSIYAWAHPDANYSLLASWVPASFPAGDGTTTFRPSWAGAPVWNELADVRVARGLDAQPLPEN